MQGPTSEDWPERWQDSDGPSGHVVPGRAVLLAIVAIVLGAILLNVGTRAPTGLSFDVTHANGTTPTTTPHAGTAQTTTTAGNVVRAKVMVLVANASSVNGVAHSFATLLSKEGWGTLTPVTARSEVAVSAVYYAAGQQAAAAELAASLSITPSAVAPLTTAVPVLGTAGASVVLVIGNDLAPKAASITATTSPAPTTTSTKPTKTVKTTRTSSRG